MSNTSELISNELAGSSNSSKPKKERSSAQKAQFLRVQEIRKTRLLEKKQRVSEPVSVPIALEYFEEPAQEELEMSADRRPPFANAEIPPLTAEQLWKENREMHKLFYDEQREQIQKLMKRRRGKRDEESSSDESSTSDEESDDERNSRRKKRSGSKRKGSRSDRAVKKLHEAIRIAMREELATLKAQQPPPPQTPIHYQQNYPRPRANFGPIERPSVAGLVDASRLPQAPPHHQQAPQPQQRQPHQQIQLPNSNILSNFSH